MISENEITKGKEVPEVYKKDLATLLDRLNKIRKSYNKPMTITSGFRTFAEHKRIYEEKALKRGVPFYIDTVPMKSKHLYCQAADVYDPNKELQKWCKDNFHELELIGLWCEDFSATPNWVHFQIYPPASGNRFFKP